MKGLKKILSLGLSLMMALSLVACSGNGDAESSAAGSSTAESSAAESSVAESDATESSAAESSSEASQSEEAKGFSLAYPESMTAKGYETLELDEVPQRIACMVTSPVFALYEMGVPMIAAPTSTSTPYPEDLDVTLLGSVAHEDFDIEAVVSLEPDLVIMSASYADSHGATLDSLDIPVYYMSAGHTVSYDSVKAETQCLVDAFSLDEESTAKAEEIMGRFTALENRLEEVKPLYEGKTVMVLQSGSTTMHYIQTERGTLASMAAMMGFTNVYENEEASMAQIDLEQALEYQPDLVLCVGAAETAEEHQALMEEAYGENPDYWNAIDAVKNGEVIYLPVNYIATSGILVVDEIDGLIDIIAEHYEAQA